MLEPNERISYGQNKLSLIDRVGVFLSKKAIQRTIRHSNNLNILDLGCGYNAHLLLSLENKIQKGTGIDFHINPNLKNKKKFYFIESPIELASRYLEENSLDVIMMISVLEHLYDPLLTLKNCYECLNKNGVLLINVPTWRGKFFLELIAFNLQLSKTAITEMDDHKMYYNKNDLWPLLVKAGFKPSKIKLKYHKFGLNLFAIIHK